MDTLAERIDSKKIRFFCEFEKNIVFLEFLEFRTWAISTFYLCSFSKKMSEELLIQKIADLL